MQPPPPRAAGLALCWTGTLCSAFADPDQFYREGAQVPHHREAASPPGSRAASNADSISSEPGDPDSDPLVRGVAAILSRGIRRAAAPRCACSPGRPTRRVLSWQP